MVPPPLPIDEISPSYFGLGDDFMPPPPLPLDGEEQMNHTLMSSSSRRAAGEPHRPPPVGRISPNSSEAEMSNISFIPVDRDRGRSDFSDGSASPTRPLSRDSWMNGTSGSHHNNQNNHINNNNNNVERTDQRRRRGPKASSPITQQGHGSSNLC